MNNAEAFRLRQLQNCGNLVAARKAAGLTQLELVKKSGVTQFVLSAWENGRGNPTLKNLVRVCDVLGVSMTYYLTGKEIEPVTPVMPNSELSMWKCRLDRKYSAKRLSRQAGISEMSIWSYERGDRSPTLFALEQICGVLNVPIDYYVGYTPKKHLDSKCEV